MRILIAAAEATPYVKTGGLADVTGSLLKEFRKKGDNVSLVLPLYRAVKERCELYPTETSVRLKMGGPELTANIWTSEKSPSPGAYFIECDELYGRDELYGESNGDYPDNALRFAFFSRAVLETCVAMDIRPDVIHCNDWQTGLVPLYLKAMYRGEKSLKKTAVLFTIHNIGYQGLFPPSDLPFTGLGRQYFNPEGIEFYGKVSYMKAGLLYSDLLNTVSVTYAREILDEEHGFGLDGVLRKRKKDLLGVVNGVDYHEWDPAADTFIPAPYSREDMHGKRDCKVRLLEVTGLRNAKLPLFGIVSRFSSQKGLDLVAGSLDELVGLGANMAILGKGDEFYQRLLAEIAARHAGRVFLRVGFEESLAHLIYAGCDFFLMPSKYEPCGLGQLIALKYGTVPVARNTGGLADTIQDFDHLSSKGTGLLFNGYTPDALRDAMKRALCVFSNDKAREKMRSNGMKADFSWERSSRQYTELYRRAAGRVRA